MPARSSPSYRKLVALAASQAGVISREQLLMVDCSDRMINNNVAAHRWIRLMRGIYSTVTGDPTIPAWWWAGHLYGGNDSRLAGNTALQAWGLERPALPIQLAIPARDRLPNPPEQLVVVRHRVARPVRHPQALPPTITLDHAVIDVIGGMTDEQDVMSLVTRVCQRRLTPEKLERALRQRSQVRHRTLILSLLAEVRDGATTALEIPGVRRILRAHGLPAGRGQVREVQAGTVAVRDRVIDEYGLVIEFDGRLGHDDPTGRLRDHRRDNSVALSGRIALRFGWVDVHREACEAALQIAQVLSARGWPHLPTPCCPTCRIRQ